MNLIRLMSRRCLLLLLVALICLTLVMTVQPATAQTNLFDPEVAQRAAVSISQVMMSPQGQPVITCVGSGTLVSADGLILTNAHVALPSARCQSDHLVIGLNIHVGEPPTPTYYAQV